MKLLLRLLILGLLKLLLRLLILGLLELLLRLLILGLLELRLLHLLILRLSLLNRGSACSGSLAAYGAERRTVSYLASALAAKHRKTFFPYSF